MFPFSSIASEIPLVVLAFAYMLYFGTYALNKSRADNSTDIINEDEQYLKSSSFDSGNKTYYYQPFSSNKQAVCSETVEKCIFPYQLNSSIKFLPDRKIIIQFFEYSLFSRPPPSLV